MIAGPSFSRAMPAVSGRGLFFAVAALSVLLMAGFSASILLAAFRAEDRLVASVEDRLLARLEEDGLSGLAAALDQIDEALVPGQDRVEVALWRVRGEARTLLIETQPGIANVFDTSVGEASDGTRFRVHDVDVAGASEGWLLPMRDVALKFGIAQPSREVAAAWRTVGTFVIAFGGALGLIFLLDFAHWRRYRRGIDDINGVLDRYSAGETGVRIEGPLPARELRVLGQHLNTVLPKLDAIFAEIRSISAHLAHELKNPLQAIRSDVRQIEMAGDKGERATLVAGVDQTIDTANGRLESVMQLFRLQADAEIAMTSGVELDQLVEDLVYDHAGMLEDRGFDVSHSIAPGIRVTANANLLELLVDNLLSNAGKYTPAGGQVAVSLSVDSGRFVLDVENTGDLPDALAETAFTRFVQGDGKGGKTGAGLGLALVASIAQKHGFDVSLRQTGGGSVRARLTGPVDGDG